MNANQPPRVGDESSVGSIPQKSSYNRPHLASYGTLTSVTGSNMPGSYVEEDMSPAAKPPKVMM